MNPILLQPLNAPLSAPVRALLVFDAQGDRNPLVNVYSIDPAKMDALEQFYPIDIQIVDEKVSITNSDSGDYHTRKKARGEEGSAKRAEWNAKQARLDAELSALLSDPTFYLVIFPEAL